MNDPPKMVYRSTWNEAYNDYKEIYKDDILARNYATDALYSMAAFKVKKR